MRLGLLVCALVSVACSAHALTLFSTTSADEPPLSWSLPDHRAPDYVEAGEELQFYAVPALLDGRAVTIPVLIFWSAHQDGGFLAWPLRYSLYNDAGDQLYRGSEFSPRFIPGKFTLLNNNSGAVDILTVRTVPEPATWGLMLLGFGLLGVRLREAGTISV